MTSEKYTIRDLEEHSGIKARTIRKYIEMGLVPQADARGPGPAYTEDHLERLKVVELLRDADRDVTLSQIRLILQGLSPDNIRAIATGTAQIGAIIDTEKTDESTALGYIRALRANPSARVEPDRAEREGRQVAPIYSATKPKKSRHRKGKARQTTVEQLVAALEELTGERTVPRSVRSETWQRIEITPDIELLIRGDFDDEQSAQFHRIGDLLRHLLTRGVH